MKLNNEIMNLLMKQAKIAFENEEIPVSCVILDKDNKVISVGINDRQSTYNVLGHAEVNAIRKAEESIKDWRLDGYCMIVTLEPCDMCSIIIKESRIDKVYYLLPRKCSFSSYDIDINKEQLVDYDKEKEYLLNLLTTFFENKR